MIIGTGIDLVDIPRFERTVTRTPRLMQRLFAPSEQSLRLPSLAARYAAKEALIKALGGSDGVHWTEIEVASEPSGRPYFVLTGTTAAAVAARGITTLHLSLTHDAGLAAAHVVAEARSGSAETPAESRDPHTATTAAGGLDGPGGPRHQGGTAEDRAVPREQEGRP